MRSVYIVTYAPIPEHSGHSRRLNANFQALSRLGECRLVILGYRPPLSQRPPLYTMGARIMPPRTEPLGRRAMRQAGAILRGDSAWLAKSLSPARIDALVRDVGAARPDMVVLGDTWLAPLVDPLRACAGRIVVDNHNVESELYRGLLGSTRGLSRLRALSTFINMRQMERHLCAADQVWAVSEDDARHFARIVGSGRVHVVPNVVPLPPEVSSAGEPGAVMFVGSYGYRPNATAADALIRISRLLDRQGTPHRLWLVGNTPTPAMEAAAATDQQITVTGLVPDTGTYVRRAAVFAAPLTEGSGTKFKLLEAMALGRAIVTTPIGAAGLDLVHGTDALVVGSEGEFVSAIQALLADPALRVRLGRAARRKVQARFSPTVLTDSLRAALAPPVPLPAVGGVALAGGGA